MPRLDLWAEWLLRSRDGGDADVLARRLPRLHETRDRVLDNADIRPGDVVLDVGTGNGLIGFGALERVGPEGRVVFSDVSDDLLSECRRIAAELGVADRSEFVPASADDLAAIATGSVDVATTRSVLIYLDDKAPAFRELHRVLRPGGRLSIFEPINRFGFPEPEPFFLGFDVRPVAHLARKITASLRLGDDHPLTNFDERDLIRWVEEAGFRELRLEYLASVGPAPLDTTDWDVLMRMSGNPLDPPLGEEIASALTPDEVAELEACLRPLVEGGAPRVERLARAFLRAVR